LVKEAEGSSKIKGNTKKGEKKDLNCSVWAELSLMDIVLRGKGNERSKAIDKGALIIAHLQEIERRGRKMASPPGPHQERGV